MNKGNLIGGKISNKGGDTFVAVNPKSQTAIDEQFTVATESEVNQVVQAAEEVSIMYSLLAGKKKAELLRKIADNIMDLEDTLVQAVMSESGLPEARVKGERGRTCFQLRYFADIVEKGDWVNAIIDEANPERTPPKSDIRTMKRAVGPVVVFTASNFPLAYSAAGVDTSSALAAGCPVIVKAHPAHPSTNALVSQAISEALKACDLPQGIYGTVYDKTHQVGKQLILHPSVKSIGFTGSFNGGMAIHKLAQQREEPIPVFAEMGSVNPVFILNEELKSNPFSLAKKLANSSNMGAGQFCTNPGIQVLCKEHSKPYLEALSAEFSALPSFTMLTEGIHHNYKTKRSEILGHKTVQTAHETTFTEKWTAAPAIAQVSASDFINNPNLHQEVFGPFALAVICENADEMQRVAEAIEGQLTCTIIGSTDEMLEHKSLIDQIARKAGRLVFNGVPTGVEVCDAMLHGGPFPATTDSRFTSVGHEAIYRFVRPLCFQDCPDALLPPELQQKNPLGIRRRINGKYE